MTTKVVICNISFKF